MLLYRASGISILDRCCVFWSQYWPPATWQPITYMWKYHVWILHLLYLFLNVQTVEKCRKLLGKNLRQKSSNLYWHSIWIFALKTLLFLDLFYTTEKVSSWPILARKLKYSSIFKTCKSFRKFNFPIFLKWK